MSVAAMLAMDSPGRILTRLAGLGSPAAAAWSAARRLREAHTGALIRVRRSSDNAEQDIGATSTGALDTAALLAFCGAGSGYVAKVYDQAGGGYDMAQATAAAQPRIVNAGALETIGTPARPTLNFYGAGHALENAAFAHGNAATVNLVAVSDGNAPAGVLDLGNNYGAGNGRVHIGGGGPPPGRRHGDRRRGGVRAMVVTGLIPGLGAVTGRRRCQRDAGCGRGDHAGRQRARRDLGRQPHRRRQQLAGRCPEVIVFKAALGDAAMAALEAEKQGRNGLPMVRAGPLKTRYSEWSL